LRRPALPKIRTLEDGIDNPLLIWTGTPLSEISGHRLVYLDETRLLIDNLELVLVNQFMVSSPELANSLIVLIQESHMSMAMPVSSIVIAFKAEENIFAFPSSGLEVGGPDGIDAVARPYKVAIVFEDIRARLARTVLL
jgi:hypothetical protein